MEDISHRAQVHLQRILDASGDNRFSPSSSRVASTARVSGSASHPRGARGSLSMERGVVAPSQTAVSASYPQGAPDTAEADTRAGPGPAYAYPSQTQPSSNEADVGAVKASASPTNGGALPATVHGGSDGSRAPTDNEDGQSWRSLHDDGAGSRAAPGGQPPANNEDGQSWRSLHDDGAGSRAAPGGQPPANNEDGQSWRSLHDDGAGSRAAPGGQPPADNEDGQSWRSLHDDGAGDRASPGGQPPADSALPVELTSLVVRVHAFACAPASAVVQRPDKYLGMVDGPTDATEALPHDSEEAERLLREVPKCVLQNYADMMAALGTSSAAQGQSPSAGTTATREVGENAGDKEEQQRDTMSRAGGVPGGQSAEAVPLSVVAEAESECESRRAVEREESSEWMDLVRGHWKEHVELAAAGAASPASRERADTMSTDDLAQPTSGRPSTSLADSEGRMNTFRFPSGSTDENAKPLPTFTPRPPVSLQDAEAQDPLSRLAQHEDDRRRRICGDEQAEVFSILEAMENNVERSYHSVQQQYPAVTDAVIARYPANMPPEAIAVCVAVEKEVIRLRQQVAALQERINYATEDNRELRRSVEMSDRRSSVAMARSRASSVLNSNWDQESSVM